MKVKSIIKIRNLIIGFASMCGWAYFYKWLVGVIWNWDTQLYDPTGPFALFSSLVQAPLIEELIFRYAPLQFVKGTPHVLPMMIISSAIFGWLHGGFINVMMQGVTGFCFAVVYVKNGYHYWSAVLLHAAWNGFTYVAP